MKHIIDYSTILPNLCAVRCFEPSFFGNGGPEETNPRIQHLQQLLTELGIPFEMDSWSDSRFFRGQDRTFHFHNIYLPGTTTRMVMAHHDIVNVNSDNCNDNSASVINAIAAKILNPDLRVVITDGEEFGGVGSHRVSRKILNGDFGQIEYVVNLELTAVGGQNFFTENYPNSRMYQKIQELFPNTPTFQVPFHDGMILRRYGVDSLVINPCPLKADGSLDLSLLGLCHSLRDNIALANYDEMDDFVRNVVTPLIYN